MYIQSCSYDVNSFAEAENAISGQPCSMTNVSSGVMLVNTTADPQKKFYVVDLVVNNTRGLTASYTQVFGISTQMELTIG